MSETTVEMRKEKAVELMSMLDIYEPYIMGFVNEDKVCFFECFAGFWVDQEPEVFQKMQELEKDHNCTVYAITHEYVGSDECYSFLFVPNDDIDWDELVWQDGNTFGAFAYVWNKTVPYDSEFGDIGVQAFGGGLRRVW